MEEDFKKISEEFSRLLALEGLPVAIKLFKNLKDLKNFSPPIKKSEKEFALCQLISQARYLGWIRFATGEELNGCRLGAACMGLMELSEEYRSGKAYLGSLYKDEEAGKKLINAIPKLDEKYEAILVSPLEKCPIEPNIVLIFGNASKMLLLLHAYLYDGKEGFLDMGKTNGIAGCANSIVPAIKNKKPIITIPCGGFKSFALPSDTDLIFTTPFNLMEEILKGLRFLYRGGVRYPHGWKFITVPIPLTRRLPEYFE